MRVEGYTVPTRLFECWFDQSNLTRLANDPGQMGLLLKQLENEGRDTSIYNYVN